ncbi:hypothetical protein PYCC9005_003356 [Savitreella phatthalungensis]
MPLDTPRRKDAGAGVSHSGIAARSRRLDIMVFAGLAGLLILYLTGLDYCNSKHPSNTAGTGMGSAVSLLKDAKPDPLFPTNVGFKGPTATGAPAQLRKASRLGGYESIADMQYRVDGQPQDQYISDNWGALKPYRTSPSWGIDERPLPSTCRIKQAHVLSRHGSRYPTAGSWLKDFGEKLAKADIKVDGPLSVLDGWKYQLGEAILVPVGKEQLYREGVQVSMLYGDLLSSLKSKPVFRSTSQERMTESALAFLEGFYGTADWPAQANLELMIEFVGVNNTLAPYFVCFGGQHHGGAWRSAWEDIYLRNRTEQLRPHIQGIDWDIRDTAALQMLCAYETNAFGWSDFCELFDWQEWQDFDYAESLNFYGSALWGTETGRAQGVGWVNQLIRRITNSPYDPADQTSENATLDKDPRFFPLDQKLFVDFTHDTVIASILTALEFTQFERDLPTTGPPQLKEGESRWSTSSGTPFGARLFVEIITADDAKKDYIHFVLNGRTLPIVLPACQGKGYQDGDGWCELDLWLQAMEGRVERSRFREVCYS